MSATVITIVAGKQAPLDDKTLEKASALVKSLGVDSVSCDVLNRGIAADVKTNAGGAGLEKALREKFASFGAYDVFVQEDNTHRRKKLLVADMDATMVEGETLDEIAARLNLKDKIAPITAKAMRGEIDFEEALRMRVGLLKDKPVSALFETLEAMRYSAGAKTLVGTMARHGARCVLISGGFDLFTGRVAQTLGFHANIGNRLGIEGDRLTGDVIPPIIDKNAKKKTVEEESRKLGLDPKQAAAAVGDGANDIPMLQTAGAGVGYFGKPAVVAATPFQIRHTDLGAILYMQGYRKEEIAI